MPLSSTQPFFLKALVGLVCWILCLIKLACSFCFTVLLFFLFLICSVFSSQVFSAMYLSCYIPCASYVGQQFYFVGNAFY